MKECNLSARYKSARSIYIVKNCSSSTKEHLYGCFKTSRKESRKTVSYVWPELDYSTSAEKISRFVPSTGTNLAWDGGQRKVCKYPAHQSKRKPYRGISREMSRKIYLHFGVLCETGQGNSL